MAGFHWKLIITNFLYLLLLLSLFQIKRIPALEFSINNFSSVSSFFCALKLWLHNHFFLSLFTFHKTCSKSMEREETASRKERKKKYSQKTFECNIISHGAVHQFLDQKEKLHRGRMFFPFFSFVELFPFIRTFYMLYLSKYFQMNFKLSELQNNRKKEKRKLVIRNIDQVLGISQKCSSKKI